MKFARVAALTTAVAALGAGLAILTTTPAYATTAQATVLDPVDVGTVNSSPDEPAPSGPHHLAYGGDYSFDTQTARTKQRVYARFRNGTGAISLTVAAAPSRACLSGRFADGGNKIVLNVLIGGAKVGTVTYAHLTNFQYTSPGQAVPNGAWIGDTVTSADGVVASSCWEGPHVHVEPRNDVKYGCYVAGLLGKANSSSVALGIVGGERATGVRQACPAGFEGGGSSGVADGTFIAVTGRDEIFRIVGGAPVYVSTWTVFGGQQPVQTISEAQFQQLRGTPRDGTYVSASPGGHVFVFAGGAPIYISSFANIGGAPPAGSITSVDRAAIENAGSGYPWGYVRRYPADGTFATGLPGGHVFRFAGGAPIYVTSFSHVPAPATPIVGIDKAAIDAAGLGYPWDHIRPHPADGTFVVGSPGGHVFRFAGGAPTYVSNWTTVGGPQPTTIVDASSLQSGGSGYPYTRTRRYPVDGTILRASVGGGYFKVTSGLPRAVVASPGATVIDAAAINNAGPSYPWIFLKRLASAPPALYPTAGHTKVRLVWSAPSTAGSSPITAYRVQRSVDGVTWTTVTSNAPTNRDYTVTALTNGVAYRFRVAPITSVGVGHYSPVAAATPMATPSAPRSMTAVPGSGRVTLTWVAPWSSGATAITAYRVQRSQDGATWTTLTSSAPLTRTFTATGLLNGASYRFRVAAINANGVGTYSPIVAATPRT